MKIATWNVNGIRARQTQIVDWIRQEQPDVICLQEIKARADQVPAAVLETEREYWTYWHGGPRGYSGVGILVRKDLSGDCPAFSHPVFDFENRIVVATFGELQVASVYVPNGGRDLAVKMRFLESLKSYAEECLRGNFQFVLCGDLNVACHEIDVHPKERGPVTGQLPQERALFEEILSGGLVDTGRALHPDDDGMFTWWAPWRNMRARNIGWRLDYILAGRGLFDKVISCEVQKDVGTSDHAPVVGTFG